MPMPWTYSHATKDWQAFLADARERMGLVSDNAAFTAVEAVLKSFRARLAPAEAIAFAEVLPAVPRALFVSGWDLSALPKPQAGREELEAEVEAFRPHHNQTPPGAIEAVAFALRRAVRQADLDRVLAGIGPWAVAYWRADADAAELERRIV